MAKNKNDKAAAPEAPAKQEEQADKGQKAREGGYILTGKNSIGGVFERKVLKGDRITAKEYDALPERIKPYFEKAE